MKFKKLIIHLLGCLGTGVDQNDGCNREDFDAIEILEIVEVENSDCFDYWSNEYSKKADLEQVSVIKH